MHGAESVVRFFVHVMSNLANFSTGDIAGVSIIMGTWELNVSCFKGCGQTSQDLE